MGCLTEREASEMLGAAVLWQLNEQQVLAKPTTTANSSQHPAESITATCECTREMKTTAILKSINIKQTEIISIT